MANNSPTSFSNLLKRHIEQGYYSSGQLAKLSGLPKATIVNWAEGRVSRPRYRKDVLKLAASLRLDALAATELFQSAGYSPLAELQTTPQDEEEERLFRTWQTGHGPGEYSGPFQAIPDAPYFVGREQLLGSIASLLTTGPGKVVCLHGMPGAGKTTLAAHLAYQLRPFFPDGVLWGQLDAVDTMSIISVFTHAYGRDVGKYVDVHSRAAVLREVLSSKRALIVLDNASGSEQVAPLLPPTGNCAVLITTRRRNLRVMSGFPTFEIGPFDAQRQEAIELFARLLGRERARAEKAELLEIAERLGHLPLAVAIVASRLSYEMHWSASDFLSRLGRGFRLDELVYENWSVNLSLRSSYDALAPGQQSFFASLGVFGSNDFTASAAGALNEVDEEQAATMLHNFHALSLVQEGRTGRFRLHPLLSDFASQAIRTPLGSSAPYRTLPNMRKSPPVVALRKVSYNSEGEQYHE